MFKSSVTRSIGRSRQDAFDYVSDPANDAAWIAPTQSNEWTSGAPHGVGSTQKSIGKMLGRRVEATYEITRWDPPHAVGLRMTAGPLSFERVVTLESAGDNETHLTASFEGEFGGFFKMAERLVVKSVQKQVEVDFDNLKLLLESEQDQAQ